MGLIRFNGLVCSK